MNDQDFNRMWDLIRAKWYRGLEEEEETELAVLLALEAITEIMEVA
jgi:hypothetical protein